MTELRDNIRWGIHAGVIFAGIFSALAIVLYLVNAASFTRLGLSLPEVLLGYVIAGVVAGGVVGALRQWTVTRLRATFTGLVAAIPASFALGIIMYGTPSQWKRVNVASCVMYAVIMGPVAGNVLWSQFARRR